MSRSLGATSKGLAARRLRNEREAVGLAQKDVARFYQGGVNHQRICKIETQRNVSRQVQADYMQALALAAAAAEASRNTAKRYNEQFAAVQNALAESQQKKEWRAMPSMPACGESLATCSPASLQSFALGRMAQASDSLKEVAEIFSQAVRQKAEAELAFWLLDYRQGAKVPVHRALPAGRKMLKGRKEQKR